MNRLVAIFIAVCMTALTLHAQDVSSQKQKKARLEEEIQFIDNQLKGTLSKQKASMQQLNLVQKKVANRKKLVDEADMELTRINKLIKQKNNEIASAQKELDTLQSYYSELIYSCYKNRDNKVWFLHVLSSNDISQGYRRLIYLKNLSATVSEQAQKIDAAKSALEEQKASLDSLASAARITRNERDRDYKSLLSEEKKSKSLVASLTKDKNRQMQELNKKKKEVEQLNREIEKILSKAVNDQKGKNVDYALSGQFAQNKSKLPWPVKGVITERFGQHNHPVYKNIKMPMNNGINITATAGAEVKCVFDGIVKQIVLMPGYGQCLLVQHGEYFTFYCKLAKVNVKNGDQVSAGQSIGTLEVSDGISVLHFQIWKGTDKQNPEEWLR